MADGRCIMHQCRIGEWQSRECDNLKCVDENVWYRKAPCFVHFEFDQFLILYVVFIVVDFYLV